MRYSCILALSILTLPCTSNVVWADTLVLKNGSTFEGEVKDCGDKYEVQMASGTMSFNKADVARIELGAEKLAAERRRAKESKLSEMKKALPPNDARARVTLAQWCETESLTEESRTLYREALAMDPECVEAHEHLGHVRYHEHWYPDVQSLVDAEAAASSDLTSLRSIVVLCDNNHLRPPSNLLSRILELNPDDEDAHQRLGHARIGGKWETDPERVMDVQSKGVAVKLMEAWKVGENPGNLWKAGRPLVTLFNVRGYAYLKSTTGFVAKLQWIQACSEASFARSVAALQSGEWPDDINESMRETLKIAEAHKGDKELLPGDYAIQRFRIGSTNKAGVQIEVMWDVYLQRVGEDWKVLDVVETAK